MDMKKYLAALQEIPGDDADTVLGMLCSAYYEMNCKEDSEEIKQAFDELYQAMTGKPLKEIDEVIYSVCTLCRDHEKAGFEEGVKVGMSLAKELHNF